LRIPLFLLLFANSLFPLLITYSFCSPYCSHTVFPLFPLLLAYSLSSLFSSPIASAPCQFYKERHYTGTLGYNPECMKPFTNTI
jgi:hypothetical protein